MGIYGVVLAHDEGMAVERVLKARFDTLAEAETAAETWSRRHCKRKGGTVNVCGFYAYGDRITRPAQRIYLNR